MRLLLDENLSPRLLSVIGRAYPGSQHVAQIGLKGEPDQVIWEHAKARGFIIVSKDNDFRQLEFLYGPPPKVVWLAVGNSGTRAVAELLIASAETVRRFSESPEEGLIVLSLAVGSSE